MGQNRVKIGSKWVKMGQNSPFWAFLGPREPPKAGGGNRPRVAKRGSTGHKNVYWDRFIPFGCHWSAKWVTIGQNRVKIGSKWVKIGSKWIKIGSKWVKMGQNESK